MEETGKTDYIKEYPNDPKEAAKILKESGIELTEEEQAQVAGGFLSLEDFLNIASRGVHAAEVIRKRFDPFSKRDTNPGSDNK